MLKEILETRFMVKREIKGLKKNKESDVLGRVLEARQLAIKLLANVTCTCAYLLHAVLCFVRLYYFIHLCYCYCHFHHHRHTLPYHHLKLHLLLCGNMIICDQFSIILTFLFFFIFFLLTFLLHSLAPIQHVFTFYWLIFKY